MALPKSKRLPGSALEGLMHTRPLAADQYMSVRAIRTTEEALHCAVIVPSAVAGNPSKRNQIKRKYAEALRSILKAHVPSSGWQCALMVRSANPIPSQELQHRILALLNKSAIVAQ